MPAIVTEEGIITDLEEKLKISMEMTSKCEAQVKSLEEKNLKLLADNENARKRYQKESQDARKYAVISIVQDFLSTYDNLCLAVQSGNDKVTEGVKLVIQQMETILSQHQCKKIQVNIPFDPNLHEAVISQPSNEHAPMSIIKELTPGFILHDRVIRPSKVIVATKG